GPAAGPHGGGARRAAAGAALPGRGALRHRGEHPSGAGDQARGVPVRPPPRLAAARSAGGAARRPGDRMRGPRAPLQLARLAERFKALGEPARLRMLDALRRGELTVSELTVATGFGQANVSKHLQILHAAGLVARRKEGLFVYYSLPDADVLLLCDIMCGRIERESEADQRLFGTGA